jgi:hypothetical protein
VFKDGQAASASDVKVWVNGVQHDVEVVLVDTGEGASAWQQLQGPTQGQEQEQPRVGSGGEPQPHALPSWLQPAAAPTTSTPLGNALAPAASPL